VVLLYQAVVVAILMGIMVLLVAQASLAVVVVVAFGGMGLRKAQVSPALARRELAFPVVRREVVQHQIRMTLLVLLVVVLQMAARAALAVM